MEFVLAQILLRCVLLSFSFSFFFFFFEELVFFFFAGSFVFPLKSLCSRSEIIRSPSNLCFSSCSFISSRSDHNFILVYWPKFTEKAKTKRNSSNLKNRSQFTEPGGRTVVRSGPSFFLHGTSLHPKQIVKLNGSRFFRSDCMVRSGFQNFFESK